MKTIIKTAAVVLFGLCLAQIALAEADSVSVVGKAQLKQKPDVAFVTFYVKGTGDTMVNAAKEADEKVDEVKNGLLKKYKKFRAIEVSDAAVGEAQRNSTAPRRRTKARIQRLPIDCTSRPIPIPRLYRMIDAAVNAGAVMQMPSTVRYPDDIRSIVVYGLLKSAPFEALARQSAMADARKQAEALAAVAGKHVGEVIRIGGEGSALPQRLSLRIMGAESDFPTPYYSQNPNEVVVSYTLSVTFELKK